MHRIKWNSNIRVKTCFINCILNSINLGSILFKINSILKVKEKDEHIKYFFVQEDESVYLFQSGTMPETVSGPGTQPSLTCTLVVGVVAVATPTLMARFCSSLCCLWLVVRVLWVFSWDREEQIWNNRLVIFKYCIYPIPPTLCYVLYRSSDLMCICGHVVTPTYPWYVTRLPLLHILLLSITISIFPGQSASLCIMSCERHMMDGCMHDIMTRANQCKTVLWNIFHLSKRISDGRYILPKP